MAWLHSTVQPTIREAQDTFLRPYAQIGKRRRRAPLASRAEQRSDVRGRAGDDERLVVIAGNLAAHEVEAVEADVHVVGASSLAAGHLTLVPQLRRALDELGRSDVVVVVGGVIPPADFDELRAAGADAIYCGFADETNARNFPAFTNGITTAMF